MGVKTIAAGTAALLATTASSQGIAASLDNIAQPSHITSWYAHSQYTTQGSPGSVPAALSAVAENSFTSTSTPASLAAATTTGPPAGIANSLASQYSTYGRSNHPTAAPSGLSSALSGLTTNTPSGVPTAQTSGASGAPSGIPASVSSYLANSGFTTYGPNNHPTARPSGAPAGVGGGPFGGHGPLGAGGPGNGFGPYQSGPWVSGPYTNWWNTAATTNTARPTAGVANGACPPANWPGWTTGRFASSAPWTTWAGCTASATMTEMVTTTDGAGATVTQTSLDYAGVAAVTDAGAANDGGSGSGVTANASVGSGTGNDSKKVGVSVGSLAVGALVVAAALL